MKSSKFDIATNFGGLESPGTDFPKWLFTLSTFNFLSPAVLGNHRFDPSLSL